MTEPSPLRLLSINLGLARPLRTSGRTVLSGIGKRPVAGPVAVGALGLAGDEQVDLSVHGGLNKAVYAYPVEHHAFWQAQRRQHRPDLFDDPEPPWGLVGENLSVQGLDERTLYIGDELHFADCVLRVTAPREPCHKFNAVMGYAQAARDMVQHGRSGFYLAVERPGQLQAGEGFTLVPRQRHLSVAEALAAKRLKHLR